MAVRPVVLTDATTLTKKAILVLTHRDPDSCVVNLEHLKIYDPTDQMTDAPD